VLAGKFGAVGSPTVAAFGPDHQPRPGGYFALPPGFARVGGWGNRVTPHLLTADLDRDGREEVVLARTGEWNEIVVYDAATRAPRWAQSFGPGGSEFISGLVAADLDRDGKLEVAGCARSGWVWLFSCDGELRWARQPTECATALAVARTDGEVRLIVGDADGRLFVFDGQGNVCACAKLPQGIQHLKAVSDTRQCRVVASTTGNTLAAFDWPPQAGAGEAQMQEVPKSESPSVFVDGRSFQLAAFPSGRAGMLMWAQVDAKPGVYAGRLTLVARKGAEVRVLCGGKALLAWQAQKTRNEAQTVNLPVREIRSLPGTLLVELVGSVTLQSLRLD